MVILSRFETFPSMKQTANYMYSIIILLFVSLDQHRHSWCNWLLMPHLFILNIDRKCHIKWLESCSNGLNGQYIASFHTNGHWGGNIHTQNHWLQRYMRIITYLVGLWLLWNYLSAWKVYAMSHDKTHNLPTVGVSKESGSHSSMESLGLQNLM